MDIQAIDKTLIGGCREVFPHIIKIKSTTTIKNENHMPLIGNIIKSALEFTDKVIPETSPVENQKDVLKNLLKKAAKTAFGKHYNFEEILNQENIAKAYAAAIPYHDYDKIHREWWQQQHGGLQNITWPEPIPYYAISSGTTGSENKRIPVSNEMLDSIRKTGINQVLSLSHFDLPSDLFEREIMMLGSSIKLQEVGDHLEGEISGISASNIPNWMKGYYRPGDEIASIADWNERVERIAESAKDWDIGAICGIPSWNELMLKRVIEYNNLNNIHEIWPGLSVFATGGVAFEPYRKSFNALMGKPITVIDTYLASEGFIAYQSWPNENMAMTLSHNNGIYFEFVPFLEENIDASGNVNQGVKSLTLKEVEENVDYVLIISTVSGVWRYIIGDTIRFTNKEKAEIIISGRTKHFLNVVGSQLSVLKMNEAIIHIEDNFNINIGEFTVAAVQIDGEFFHHWYLGVDGGADENELGSAIDSYLQDINKGYRVAREKALKGIKISVVHPNVFYKWNEHTKKKGGQVKMPRVMKEGDFKEFQDFINSQEAEMRI